MPAGDAAEGLAGVDFNSSSLTMETRLKGGKALWSGKIASDSESEFRLRFRSISGLLLKSNGVVDVNSEDPLFRRSLELSRLSEDLDTGTGTFSNLGRLDDMIPGEGGMGGATGGGGANNSGPKPPPRGTNIRYLTFSLLVEGRG